MSTENEQQWIRARLDRIDENIVRVLVGQTNISNKVDNLDARVTELEGGHEALDRKIDAALLPGRAIRWLAAVVAIMAALIGGLKAIGLKIAIEQSPDAQGVEDHSQPPPRSQDP